MSDGERSGVDSPTRSVYVVTDPEQERGELISRPPIIVYSGDIERLRRFGQENGYGDSATAFHALLNRVTAEALREAAEDQTRRIVKWLRANGEARYEKFGNPTGYIDRADEIADEIALQFGPHSAEEEIDRTSSVRPAGTDPTPVDRSDEWDV